MPALTRFARTVLAVLALACLALWVPVAFVAYVPGWHAASCDWHDRCDRFDRDEAFAYIDELRTFMQHRGELNRVQWSAKETAHLTEVRGMLDQWAARAGLSLLVWLHAGRHERRHAANVAIVAIAACALVLPVFGNFWHDVFHPLLFHNGNWMNYPADVSWWIMPRLYFQATAGLVIGVAVAIAALARFAARDR